MLLWSSLRGSSTEVVWWRGGDAAGPAERPPRPGEPYAPFNLIQHNRAEYTEVYEGRIYAPTARAARRDRAALNRRTRPRSGWSPPYGFRIQMFVVVIIGDCAAKDKLHDARERVVVFDVPHGGSSVACVATRTTSGATREGSRAGEGRA